MSGPRNLDFLVIGAPKAGTTSLFHYLSRHPKIYIPAGKEIPFFSNDERFALGWDAFFHEFLEKSPSDSLLGKVTPQYMDRPVSIVPERIFSLMPMIKLIALLRNPIDRAFSHYRMLVRFNWESRRFEEAVTAHLETRKPKAFFTASHYGQILNQYLKYFPPQQLLIRFTDDLEKTPATALDSILDFIGLEKGFRPQNLGKRYHAGGRQRFPVLTPIVRRIRPLKWLYRKVPLSRRVVIWEWFSKKANIVQEDSPAIDPGLRRQLVELYLPDIQLLESITGQKVPWDEFHR